MGDGLEGMNGFELLLFALTAVVVFFILRAKK